MKGDVRYVHLRVHTFDKTDVLPKPDVRGGCTIAYQITNMGEGEAIPVVKYHIAKCNMKDNFCRKLGRHIAAGRLAAGKFLAIPINKDTKNKEIVSMLITKYYEEEERFWHDVAMFVY